MDRRLILAAVPAALALAACGSRDNPGTSSSSGGPATVRTVKLAVTSPFTGDLTALGLGIRNSVDLAVRQANQNNTIPGWKIELLAVDDAGKNDIGRNAATQIASDDLVIGVVGNLNSSVSQQTQSVFAGAKIAQVSPANTNPTLTKVNGKRAFPSYFRTCTTDDVQGPFAARYLKEIGITKVATVHDKKTYGQGLVEAFTAEFTAGGGQIVGRETADSAQANATVATKLKALAPQVVYYGGEYPLAGPLSRALANAGLNVPLMGGDGIYSGDFIKLGGKTGDLATSVGAPTDKSEAGKKFLADYQAAGFTEPSEAYGGYSYDAAVALIKAMAVSLKDAKDVKSAREATITALGAVSFEGVTGKVGFNEFGDAISKVLTVYKVDNGKWVDEKTGEFK